MDKLKDAGTPDDIDDDERHGFEDVVEDEDDRAEVTKFFNYFAETCVGLPTDTPTGLPSEFPTDLPSDIPTDSTELPS